MVVVRVHSRRAFIRTALMGVGLGLGGVACQAGPAPAPIATSKPAEPAKPSAPAPVPASGPVAASSLYERSIQELNVYPRDGRIKQENINAAIEVVKKLGDTPPESPMGAFDQSMLEKALKG
ncbi:MAG: hypothetical protein IT307_16730 [Chloroflexi bacterium]|nr:hypothetical protein [Chloroflexota bacterium]